MTLARDLVSQGLQMLLVLLLAPLLTGFIRKLKAQLLRRQGPPLLQPYRDLIRLMRKDVVLADSASWLFRIIPYIIFAGTWVGASFAVRRRAGVPKPFAGCCEPAGRSAGTDAAARRHRCLGQPPFRYRGPAGTERRNATPVTRAGWANSSNLPAAAA